MKHIDRLCVLGIDDKELRKAIRGSYQPGFMQIRLAQPYNGDLNSLDIHELGTLLHEYVHFLQNISTPWGLFTSMVEYNRMIDTYKFISEAELMGRHNAVGDTDYLNAINSPGKKLLEDAKINNPALYKEIQQKADDFETEFNSKQQGIDCI